MYKALVSFSGLVTMSAGEVKKLTDPAIIKDLLKAGYIVKVKGTQTEDKGTQTEDKGTQTEDKGTQTEDEEDKE